MSGHILGAAATLTPQVFKLKATQLVKHFDGDREKVSEFYRQARLARFIIEADYLMTSLLPGVADSIGCVNISGGGITPIETKA